MIAPSDVIGWLKLTDVPAEDPTLLRVLASTNSYVAALPVVTRLDLAEDADWPDHVNQGAVMLASRYMRRRNSPNGVEAITEGGAAFVARHDPDIARLLQLDGFQRPQVG